MTTVAKAKPYFTLDAWRGFAALWVVLSHSCLSTPFCKVSPLVNQYQKAYLFSLAGYLGVQIFFVISGYCIAGSLISTQARGGGVLEFIKARLWRIYPPYLFGLALAVLYSCVVSALASRYPVFGASVSASVHFFAQPALFYLSSLTLTTYPLHIPSVLGISWTLNYEVAFYGLMALMFVLLARRGKIWLLNGLHLLTAASLALLIFRPGGILFPFDLWPQFGLGVLAYDLLTQPRRAWTWGILAVIVLETLAFGYIYTFSGVGSPFEHWRHSALPSRVLACLIFFAALLALYKHDEALERLLLVRFLSWIGGFSYTLYLTHFLCVNLFSILGDTLGVTAATFPLIYFAKVVGAVGLARLLYPLIEKPFLQSRRRLPTGVAQLSSLEGTPQRIVP